MSEIVKFDTRGIERIEIPIRDEDLRNAQDYGKSLISKYLPTIFKTHKQNAEKVKFFYDFFKGQQDVYHKERLYEKDQDNNNQIVENHAYRQVNFKTGFLIGEKRVYTSKDGESSDDLKFLDRYMTDVDFWSKDKDLKEWVFATGIGVTHCEPRTDIIIPSGKKGLDGKPLMTYADASQGYNKEKESPFNFEVLDPCTNLVVYSTSRNKEPLFCISIAKVDVGDGKTIDIRYKLQIETKYATFETKSDLNYVTIDDLVFNKPKALRYLPMVEHSINSYRMGLIELNRDLFNSINTLISSVSDIIVDTSNVILVFKNVDITAEQVKEMKLAGAIVIKDNSAKGIGADLDTIKIQIDFNGFDKFYEQRLSKAYDIAGVPIASGQVTSGGDTGQARLLGGGWNIAYTIISNEITSLLKGDYAVLKLMIMFCRQIPQSPINQLWASDIDIKYRINQNDNFLVKAEGIAQLYAVNLPKEEIIKASGLFSDTNAVATQWEANDAKIKAEQQAQAQQIATSKAKNSGGDTNVDTKKKDNNSKE